jgi:hypothetical protein
MRNTLVAGLLAGVACVATAQPAPRGTDNLAPGPLVKPTITAEQRARLEEKLQRINQIMQSVNADTQAQPAGSRTWMLESLLKMTNEQVAQVPVSGGFRATADQMSRATKVVQKNIGDAGTDLVYRPITPCRFIDTRFLGGPINGSRDYTLSGDGGPNGGSAACNPVTLSGVSSADDIAAVSMNVAIVGPPGAPGFIGARPPGSANATALVNWYQAGPQVQASNAGVVSTLQNVGNPNEIEFFGSPTDIVVDIMGVFTRPDATPLACTQTIFLLNNVANGTRQTGQALCDLATQGQVVGGGIEAVSNDNTGSFINALAPTFQDVNNQNGWFGSVTNNSGSTQTYRVYAICCRVPGR